jgi:TolB-like protein/tetratricopeptide (TPR) repeat protein
MSLYAELKRRNVFRVMAAYVVVGWLTLQLADIMLGFIEAPDWVGKAIIALLVLGFVPAIAIAWIFEVTPEGIVRDPGNGTSNGNGRANGNHVAARRLDIVTLVAVVIVAVLVFWEHLQPVSTDVRGEVAPTAEADARTDVGADVVADVGAAMPRTDSTPIATDIPANSIAVLPFSNRSAEDDTQYFVDGVHDDLLTQLARIGDLKVISRTSVMEYRDTTKNMRQIGQELGVATILEGAVQRAGDRVRITAQLIDTESDQHLWADSFDRELTTANIFDIQTDIARAIATALVSTLTPEAVTEIVGNTAPTDNQAAYDLYLRGRAQADDGAPFETIIDLYQQAVDLDPDFALAIGEIGLAYTNRYWYSTKDPAYRDEGRRWIERALALAPDEPRLHWIMADHLYHGYLDYAAALRELEIAERGSPNSAEIYNLRGWILRRRGEVDAAIRSFTRAVNLDPLNVAAIADLAWSHMSIGQFAESDRWRDRMGSMPNTSTFYRFFGPMTAMGYNGDTGLVAAFIAETGFEAEVAGGGVGEAFAYPVLFQVAYLERRYADALAKIAASHGRTLVGQWDVRPVPLMRAMVARAQDDTSNAKREAEAALIVLDEFLVSLPGDARALAARAQMLAILGRAEEARLDARAAIAAYPISRDAIGAPNFLVDELITLAMIADTQELVARMRDYLELEIKAEYFDFIVLDPVFDAHREDPAFRELARAYSLRPEDWQ